MKVGCTLPQSGALASPENLVRVAKRAEELGYDSVWVFERLLWLTNPRDPYPPSRDGSGKIELDEDHSGRSQSAKE